MAGSGRKNADDALLMALACGATVENAATLESAKTLLALQNESQPAAVRLGAARAVVALGVKLREAAEMEERLAALEQRMDQSDAIDRNGRSRNVVGF